MSRINKFRESLEINNIDTYFVGDISNVYYLSGFTGSTAFLIFNKDKNLIISDGRYEEQISIEVNSDFEVHIVNDYEKAFKQFLSSTDSVYIDTGASLSIFNTISKYNNIKIDENKIIENMRAIKDENELKLIRDSYKIAGEAFKKMLEKVRFGMTENLWAAELEYNMKILGARSVSFDTIMASGSRGALPHGIASDKKISENEPIIIDFGCKKYYCSDITRVVYNADDDFVNKIIEIVDTARDLAIKKVKAGIKCCEIDMEAREYIKSAGYENYFNHGLGHSLGIDVHENPRFSKKDETVLEEGMVLTIEPGIYLPGKFGIRLEDTVAVTKKGCELLSAVLDKRVYEL